MNTNDSKIRDVPTVPSTHWLAGSVKDFFNGPFQFLNAAQKNFGGTFRFRAGPKWFYIFTEPRHAREIFSKSWEVFPKEQNSKIVLGESLLTSDGDTWARQRKHAQKYFAKPHLNTLFATLHQTIQRRHERQFRDSDPRSRPLDIHKYSVDVICDLVVALLYKARPKGDFSELADDVHLMVDYIRRYSSSLIKIPLWIPTPRNREFLNARRRFEAYIRPLHEEATQAREENLLHYLSEDPQCSPEELYNEALTFYVAGFETTANALFWTLHLLAKNPSAIQKIKDEVRNLDLTRIQNFDDLKSLAWTRACVNEGLRLYPVAWFRSKIAARDENVGEFLVKKGGIVWICIYLTHRNETLWPNPEHFRPERFLPGESESQIPLSYIPFGGGRTVCIGREMAIMEMVMVLAHFFKDFNLDTRNVPDIKPIPSITIRPATQWLAMVTRNPAAQVIRTSETP